MQGEKKRGIGHGAWSMGLEERGRTTDDRRQKTISDCEFRIWEKQRIQEMKDIEAGGSR